MSSIIVAKASLILAFKFVISGDRGGQGVGQSHPIHLIGNVASISQMLQMLQ
jgi:hypothetical protein